MYVSFVTDWLIIIYFHCFITWYPTVVISFGISMVARVHTGPWLPYTENVGGLSKGTTWPWKYFFKKNYASNILNCIGKSTLWFSWYTKWISLSEITGSCKTYCDIDENVECTDMESTHVVIKLDTLLIKTKETRWKQPPSLSPTFPRSLNVHVVSNWNISTTTCVSSIQSVRSGTFSIHLTLCF